MSSRAAIIEDLRAHLAKVAPMREMPPPTPTGIAALDAHIGGWPQPGIAHIHGAIGSGRMALVLPAMQAHTQGRTVAVVDPMGWLYPLQRGPAALDVGSMWKHQAGWATTQLAGSGALPMIILWIRRHCLRTRQGGDGERPEHCSRAPESLDPRLSAQVRLRCMGGGEVRIERGASGSAGRSLRLGL